MAIRTLARAAVLFSVAGALSLEPELASAEGEELALAPGSPPDAEACGSSLPGYVLIADGLLWADSWQGNARNTTDCGVKCSAAESCLGFTARVPKAGKMQCTLYKAPQKVADKYGMSYSRCTKGLKCDDGEGFLEFSFSHAGTWKHGVKMAEIETIGRCAKACRRGRACVGFTYRRTAKEGGDECWHFENEANKQRTGRDTHTTTYSKCPAVEQEPPSA